MIASIRDDLPIGHVISCILLQLQCRDDAVDGGYTNYDVIKSKLLPMSFNMICGRMIITESHFTRISMTILCYYYDH